MRRFLQISGFVSLCLAIFYSVFKWFTHVEFSTGSSLCFKMSSNADFYSNAFNNLISIHVGLFTALIAVTIAVFGIQKWFDHKDYEEVKNMMPDEIKKVVAENKGAIIDELNSNLQGRITSEVEKKSRDYLQTVINTNIKVFSGDQKRLFCMQMINYIWNDLIIKKWGDGLIPLFNYHIILQQLLSEIKERGSVLSKDDYDFGELLLKIQKELNSLKSRSEIVFSSNIGDLAKKIDELVLKFSPKNSG